MAATEDQGQRPEPSIGGGQTSMQDEASLEIGQNRRHSSTGGDSEEADADHRSSINVISLDSKKQRVKSAAHKSHEKAAPTAQQRHDQRSRHHHSHHSRANPAMLVEQELSLTATDYKNAGNKLCSLYRYEEALQCYEKAISKDPDVPIFYSNKALCHLKLQQWPAATQDCRKALELDPNLIKAHFFLGQTLAETGQYDEALKHLQRAHELAREKQLNFGDDIAYQIRLTKRRRWSKIESDNAQLEEDLHNYLVNLIKKDTDQRLRELKERLQAIRGEGSSSQPISETVLQVEDETVKAAEEANISDLQAQIRTKCDIYTDKLETMFHNLQLQRGKREVPDYLCGKISFEVMHDPVITPSGITYDRQDIEEHLRRVGHFDPITRQPLTASQLVSNLAMKEVVDAYLSENEWANHY